MRISYKYINKKISNNKFKNKLFMWWKISYIKGFVHINETIKIIGILEEHR